VGQTSAGFFLLVVALLTLLGLGVYAYARQLMEGLAVTGMRNIGTMRGATWGLYISFDVYFVGVSFAGITVAALIRIFNLVHLRPVSRMAELLTVVSLLAGGIAPIIDLGRPGVGIVNLFLYARPQSPFFGTFTLVITGYLFASLVYLYLDGRRDAALCAQRPGRLQWFHRLWAAGYQDTPAERERHSRTSFWLALAILPLLLTAHSTLGFIFGIQTARPGWFSTLQAPAFVIMAGISGVGLLIVIAAITGHVLQVKDRIGMEAFKWLSNFLWVLTLVYFYFLIAEWLTTNYAPEHADQRVSTALLTGEYAWLFWLSMGFLAVALLMGFGQFALRRYSLPLMVLAGVAVNLAAIGKRFLIVVPSQTHGTLLPYLTGFYRPTWVEYSIILGLFSLAALLYVLFIKVFPIMEVPQEEEGG
jgi:molybdopterin-containing oxidoreductase family membrane subunit